MLGADHVVASRMVVEDGRYTGEVAFYAFGPYKAEAMRELAAQHGWDLADCYAYTDSATDLPMLEAVGHPYAVNPDRSLRREAIAARLADAGVPAPRPVAAALRRSSGCADRPLAVGIAGAAVVRRSRLAGVRAPAPRWLTGLINDRSGMHHPILRQEDHVASTRGYGGNGAPVDEQSLGELVATATRDLSALIHQEIELAKAELAEQAKKAGDRRRACSAAPASSRCSHC